MVKKKNSVDNVNFFLINKTECIITGGTFRTRFSRIPIRPLNKFTL